MLTGEAQLTLNPHPEFHAYQRFDEVVIGSKRERMVRDSFLFICSHYQDRKFQRRKFTSDLANHGITIHVGHHQVQNQ